tara:strand:+ start:45971 stop:46363 length:393 start_codon:yes stop_codon:yes gene_type:complete
MNKYFCYFNLHKHVFSLRNHKTKLVEYHADTVMLSNCELKVSQAGRNRVLKEKRKNVHAGVQGTLMQRDFDIDLETLGDDFIELTYQPYKYDSFVVKATEVPVMSAETVILHGKRVFARKVSSLPLEKVA